MTLQELSAIVQKDAQSKKKIELLNPVPKFLPSLQLLKIIFWFPFPILHIPVCGCLYTSNENIFISQTAAQMLKLIVGSTLF